MTFEELNEEFKTSLTGFVKNVKDDYQATNKRFRP